MYSLQIIYMFIAYGVCSDIVLSRSWGCHTDVNVDSCIVYDVGHYLDVIQTPILCTQVTTECVVCVNGTFLSNLSHIQVTECRSYWCVTLTICVKKIPGGGQGAVSLTFL